MAGNLLYGFLCVRLLPIPDYAKYAVVFGFLATLSIFTDIGFSNALLPLIGERVDDRRLIADYVASLRQLAHWLYFAAVPLALIVYPLIVRRQDWSLAVVAAMLGILLTAVWCARVSGAYGAVLIVRRDRKSWYRAQMTSSIGTLALLAVAWAAHLLTGFSAMLINVAGMAYVAIAYFLRARHLLGVSGVASREKRNAIVHFVAPNLPGIIFYAFQAQFSLLLITYFGHATAVASMGALTRLGQTFALFGQMSPLLIEPYFAKLPAARVKRNYLGLFVVELLLCGTVAALSRFFPGLFLWILGHKYSSLHYEVFLMMAISSIAYFNGVLWVVHNARRFVYWWNSIAVIVLTLGVQSFCIWRTDLSTIRGVLIMTFWTWCGTFAITIISGIYGFKFGPRRIAETSRVASSIDNMPMSVTSHSSPPRPLSIGVLVLNYNTWDIALRALNGALELEMGNVSEFVLFDDGSPTPPPDRIDSRIKVIRGASNVGFAQALQTAFSLMKSDVVVLFDSDACPLTPFAQAVRKHFESDPRLGQLGFRAEDQNGSQTESYFAEPTQWTLILGQALYGRLPRRALQASRLCVITGCMATRMDAYRDIGGFDPELNFLDVDVDYGMRLRRKGWKILTDTSIKAFHVGGGTPLVQRNRVMYFYKSRWYLLCKHRLFWSPRAARALILARLRCEMLVLRMFGRCIFRNPAVLEDKVLGRQALLSLCRSNFH